MRKLLLTLVACIVAIAANAGTLYLVGGGQVDGKALGGSPNGNCLAITSETDVYTFTVNNISWLKISDTNASDWGTFNKNGFTIDGKGDYAIKPTELGTTFKLWYSNGSSEGTNNINPPSTGEYVYTLTVGAKGTSNSTLVVTSKGSEVITYEIYLRGSWNSFGSVEDKYKFTPDAQGEVYTLSGVTLSKGIQFKIADANWGSINYGNGQSVNANTSYTLTYNGNDMTLNQDITNATITFNTVTETMYINDPSAGEAETPEPNYSNWWVNLGGEFNGNNFYDGGVQPVDKVATFTNQAIGNKGFKIKVYDTSDIYYIGDGITEIPTNEWVQFVEDTFDIQMYIENAPADGVYTVKYNVETNKIFIEQTGGSNPVEPEPEPTYPENMYIIGTINGNGWNPANVLGMLNEGDGIYSVENVTLNTVDGSCGFAFTAGGSTWEEVNDYRFGPAENDTKIAVGEELEDIAKNSNSYSIEPGIYNFTICINPEEPLIYVEKVGDVNQGGGDEPTPEVPETTWVVNGNYNGDSSWSTPVKFTSYADGVYSTDKLDQLVEFKLTENGTWYGYDGTGYAPLGETFKVASGDEHGNVIFGLSGYVKDAVIHFNPTTLEVKVDGTWVSTALELYIRGEMNNWGNSGLTDEYKLSTLDGNIYTITLPTIEAGKGFKIASANWSPEYTTNNTSMSTGTYNITGGGNMALGVTINNVTLTLDIEQKTLTISGQEEGYLNLYLRGSMNNWEATEDWKFATEDGESYTLANVTIPDAAQFKVADADWTESNTYSLSGKTVEPNVEYTLENLTSDADNMNVAATIENATVTYNRTTHAFEISAEVAPVMNEITLELTGVANAAELVQAADVTTEVTPIEFTEGKATLQYGEMGVVSFAMTAENVEAGYSYTITCKEGESKEDVWQVQSMSANGSLSDILAVWPAANGYTFVINVEKAPDMLTLNFTADNFKLGSDINDYVTVVDMWEMFSSEGESDGVLTINENPYEYTYAEGQTQMWLQLTPVAGYEINVALENAEGVQIDVPTTQTETWIIQGGMIGRNVIANITITKEPEYEMAYLGVSTTGVPEAPNSEYPLTLNEEDGTFTGNFSLNPGEYFNIWVKKSADNGVDALDLVPVADYIVYGPTDETTVVNYDNITTSFSGKMVEGSDYAWQLDATIEEALDISFDINPATGEMVADNNTTILPEGTYLGFDEFNEAGERLSIDVYEGVDEAVTLPIGIQVYLTEGEDMFEYQGFQFGITLPEWVTDATFELNEGFGSDATATFEKNDNGIYVTVYDMGHPNKSDLTTLGNVLISTKYSEGLEEGLYDVVVVEPIVFSTTLGEDIKMKGFKGQIQLNVFMQPTLTAINITNVELSLPSYMANFNKDEASITIGENLDLYVELLNGEDVVEEGIVVWTPNVEGVAVSAHEMTDGVVDYYFVTTEGVESETPVTVELVGKIGEVVTKPYSFELRPVLLGDANDNNEVTVADVVTVANFIVAADKNEINRDVLGEYVVRFDEPNADVVGEEGVINTEDVTAIVNIVMNGYEKFNARRRAAATMSTADALVIDNFRVSLNKPFEIGVSLDNTNAYAAIQATVEIPEGMTVIGLTKGERAAAHQMIYRITENGDVNVVLYSNSNAAFAAGEGSIFNLVVTANEEAGNITIDRIHASDANSNGYDLGFIGGVNDSITTGIYDLTTDDAQVRYFTVDGIEIQNPEAGQIVIRMEGSKVEKVVVK